MPTQVYLSRRNLLVLLSKLDRAAKGEATACSILKYAAASPPGYKQSVKSLVVTAVEDEKYYATRAAGPMHPDDEPKNNGRTPRRRTRRLRRET